MQQKSISLRITAEEFAALKALAKREVRTISSWIRAKIVSEGKLAGIVVSAASSEANEKKNFWLGEGKGEN
jgi:hypothetical protein